MKKFTYFRSVFFVFLFAFLYTNVAAEKVYKSVGYIPNWSYNCYKTLDYTALTHLNIAFCNPDANGNLSAGINDTDLRAIIAKAHENGVKVMASLGGAGYSTQYPNLVNDANRAAFCDKIISFAKKYSFDGVDLDVEGEAAAAFWTYYEAWVAALRVKCDAENLLLTTAAGQWYADKITNKTLEYFDFVTIMEYDLKASNYQGRINYWLNTKAVKADNLVLGVPFYGYKNNSYTSYKDILTANPDAWYVSNINGCTYHNPTDIAAIAVMSKTYSGIMIWELSQDVSGDYSLLNAAKYGLFGIGAMPQITTTVSEVTLSPAKMDLVNGRVGRLTPTVLPADATVKSVKWSSNNTSIATVDNTGLIKAVGVGRALITATSINGNKTASTLVNIVSNTNANGLFDGNYKLIALHSNKVMEVKNKSAVAGARMQQWESLSGDNNKQQWWSFTRISGDVYYIKSEISGLYLTAMGTANDAKIEQHPFTGNPEQTWKINEIDQNVFTIMSVSANRALDVAGPSIENGAEIHLWEYLSGNNQKWMIAEVNTETSIGTSLAENLFTVTYSAQQREIEIKAANTNLTIFKIYNLSGEMIQSGKFSSDSFEINASELRNGVYLLSLTTKGGENQITKILIND